MRMMYQLADSERSFILIHEKSEGVMDGMLYAVASDAGHGEVVALWAPRLAMRIRREVIDLLCHWAKGLGLDKILAVTTRSPETFFKMFYEEIGFEKVGLLLERRL